MKAILLAVSLLFAVGAAHAQPKTLELPITLKDGYGSFWPMSFGINWDDTTNRAWRQTHQSVKGIPVSWQSVKKGAVWLNLHQFAYQNWKAGKLADGFYKDLRENWDSWPADSLLTPQPIRCTVYVITGIDATGQQQVMIDTNTNLDFSDEQPFMPPAKSLHLGPANFDALREITYEHFTGTKVVFIKTKLAVWRMGNALSCNFPLYATANLTHRDSTYAIAAVSQDFVQPGFTTSAAAVLNKVNPERGMSTTQMAKEGEFLRIGTLTCRYLGIDPIRNVMRLQEVDPTDSLYSTQASFKAPPFSGTEFSSDLPISLSDYRGKYVLIDFWGTWCTPCVGALPKLKAAYEQTSRDLVEFIGIVAHDTPVKLKPLLQQEGVQWPQILVDDHNPILRNYKVRSFPTMFLIDPSGKVFLSPLQGHNVLSMLKALKLTKP